MTQTETDFQAVERGQIARLVYAEVADIVATFEAGVIATLISHYTANKATHEILLSGVAEIAAYRKLLNKLDREIKQGIEAQAERYS